MWIHTILILAVTTVRDDCECHPSLNWPGSVLQDKYRSQTYFTTLFYLFYFDSYFRSINDQDSIHDVLVLQTTPFPFSSQTSRSCRHREVANCLARRAPQHVVISFVRTQTLERQFHRETCHAFRSVVRPVLDIGVKRTYEDAQSAVFGCLGHGPIPQGSDQTIHGSARGLQTGGGIARMSNGWLDFGTNCFQFLGQG